MRFEALREQNGTPAVAIRDLLKAALRHRPDRILLGEIRSEEALYEDVAPALRARNSESEAVAASKLDPSWTSTGREESGMWFAKVPHWARVYDKVSQRRDNSRPSPSKPSRGC